MAKTCSTCRQPKEDGEFSVDKASKDKLCNKCKECAQKYKQTHWSSRIVSSSRQHDNDDHRPTDSDDYITIRWVEGLVRNYPNCHYCGVPLKFGLGINRSTNPDGLQLDRMDSSLEHAKSNCVQCCKTCNNRCGTMPYKWKKMYGGGNLACVGMKWCPSNMHDGGDGSEHVRKIGDFGPNACHKDGLDNYCKSCKREKVIARKEKNRALKKLKTQLVSDSDCHPWFFLCNEPIPLLYRSSFFFFIR